MKIYLYIGMLLTTAWLIGCTEPPVAESSGLAPSRHTPGLFWTHNDGPNLLSGQEGDRHLYLLNDQGAIAATAVVDVANGDWEDLARFTADGRPYLLLAATGDNDESREESALHLFPEPAVGQRLVPERTIRFRFPDGAHDCEAVAVDPLSESVILIAKRARPAGVYRIGLHAPGDQVVVAERIAELANIPLPDWFDKLKSPFQGRYAHQPTALDIRDDGRQVAVLTYKAVYVWDRMPEETWAQMFARTPASFPLPGIRQYEGMTYAADGTLVISQEDSSALVRIKP